MEKEHYKKITIGTVTANIRQTEMPLILKYCENQIKRKLYPVILVVGRQRTGKTFFALWLAEQIAMMRREKFDIESDMFFSIEDMALRYKEARKKALILDEASVSLLALESNSIHQRVFTKIMDSQAYLENILIICLPSASSMGKYHIQQITALVEMRGRGYYSFFGIVKRYSDLTRKPPFAFEIETLSGIPLPSAPTVKRYLELGQTVFKQDILDAQIEIFAEKRMLKAERKIPKRIPLKVKIPIQPAE